MEFFLQLKEFSTFAKMYEVAKVKLKLTAVYI